MSNMLEILSRHWAVTSASTSGGRGGVPELTETDISHALGCLSDKAARETVLVVWNHHGVTRQTRHDVETEFRNRLVREYAARERELVASKLELHLMECEYEGVNNTALRHKALRPYRAAVDHARMRTWPWDAAVYRRVFGACTQELRNPRTCPDCNGRAAVIINQLKLECPGCEGTGKKSYMKKARASAIGVSYPAYRESWHKVYEWGFRELADAQNRVINELYGIMARVEKESPKEGLTSPVSAVL